MRRERDLLNYWFIPQMVVAAQQPGLELVPIWEANIEGGSLTCCATKPIPFASLLFSI